MGLLGGILFWSVVSADETAYVQDLTAWRTAHAQRLQGDEGWLTVAGLYWLNAGENHVGTDPSNDIVLRAGSAPAHVGVFDFRQGTTTFHAAEGVEVKQQGRVVRSATLTPGPGTGRRARRCARGGDIHLVAASERSAVCRAGPRPPESAAHGFHRLQMVSDRPHVSDHRALLTVRHTQGRDHAQHHGRLGTLYESRDCPVRASGTNLRLQPVSTGTDRLFFVFRDQTSGHETYGAARFLVTDGPQDGQVLLDFNKAVNPPCAYNPYTTCPLPLKENRLPIRIEAGELQYH